MTEQVPAEARIRTPDRRLRVFVSSALGEMAEERQAVSRAITALRLTPVMFEAGARPHPPTELYRAYLAQSDIFIGLYWQRYGWIGPGMEISGLEDEFERSGVLPRLVYVKAPAPDRESRLARMLDRIKATGALSYRSFHSPAELARLVRDDLAALLSERFAVARDAAAGQLRPVGPPRTPRLPVATTSLVGRAQAITEVSGLIGHPDTRLATLTGPGGVGKTRLALAVGEAMREHMDGRVAFVALIDVVSSEALTNSIGRAVGADLGGLNAPLSALIEQLGDDRWLLILDNLDQAVEVVGVLDELLARCSNVTILATSRAALQLQAEHEYPVPALSVPTDAPRASVEQIEQSPAVALFVDRARAVRPAFALTARNVRAVAEICRRLEGLPLAIELAAARTRLQEPEALLPRLTVSLDALGAGPRNLPERQRTLRATVDWSIALLDDDERSFLETVAVFVDGWTPQAAASVTGLDEDRALELSETLARHSLIYLDLTDRGARLRMLDTVRAFVGERLRARRDNAAIERRHADYYRALVEQADRPLRVAGHHEWTERLRTEAGNLAAAIRWYLDHDRRPLPHLFRVLWPFWEQQDHMGEARAWIERLLTDTDELNPEARAEVLWTALVTANEVGDDAGALAACDRLAPLVVGAHDHSLQAVSQLAMAWTVPILGDLDQALRGVLQALEQLQHQDEPYWTAVALTTAGNLEMALDRYDDALRRVRQARDLAGRLENRWLEAWAQVQLGILTVTRGPRGQARVLLDEGLDFSLAAGSTSLISFCLVGFAQLALAEGDPQQAALAAGAADGLRQRAGLRAWPMLRRSEVQLLAAIRAAVGTDRFDQLYPAGKRLTQEQAVGVARSWTPPAGQPSGAAGTGAGP